MCRWQTEGTTFTKCGHYIQTKWVKKIDCGLRYCTKSDQHPPNCRDCSRCEQHFYPDDEKVTAQSDNWCRLCESWYGEEAKRNGLLYQQQQRQQQQQQQQQQHQEQQRRK